MNHIIIKRKNMKNIIFLLFISSFTLFAQGKILSKEEANKIFGPVEISKEISSDNLKQFTLLTVNKIMFKIINNEIYILDHNRNLLFPLGATIGSTDVFSVYSVSIVQQLLSQGNNPITYIEKRKRVLIISNGVYTLEYSSLCPPFCNY